MMMFRFKSRVAVVFLTQLLLSKTAQVQGRVCLLESASLDNCFETNDYDDATEDACEECLVNAVYSTFSTEDCFAVLSEACGLIATCSSSCGGTNNTCGAEVEAYVGCEVNDKREEAPMIEPCPPAPPCTAVDGGIPPENITTLPPIPGLEDEPITLCLEENADLGNCFDANGFGLIGFVAPGLICGECLEAAIEGNYQGDDCASIAEAVVMAVEACECGDNICIDEIEDYVSCELNKERREEGLPPCDDDLIDLSPPVPSTSPATEDSQAPAPDTTTPAPGPVDETPPPTATPTSSSSESSSLMRKKMELMLGGSATLVVALIFL